MKKDKRFQTEVSLQSLKVSNNRETHEQKCDCVWNIQGFENSETSYVRGCL